MTQKELAGFSECPGVMVWIRWPWQEAPWKSASDGVWVISPRDRSTVKEEGKDPPGAKGVVWGGE